MFIQQTLRRLHHTDKLFYLVVGYLHELGILSTMANIYAEHSIKRRGYVISENNALNISNFFLQIMIHIIIFLLYNVYLKNTNWIAV